MRTHGPIKPLPSLGGGFLLDWCGLNTSMNIGLKLITAPTAEPVEMDSHAIPHLRPNSDAEEKIIGRYLVSARDDFEKMHYRQLMTATYELYLDEWPPIILVPRPPLQSITSVKYVDTDGTTQTLSTGDYYLDSSHQPARITLKNCPPSLHCHITPTIIVRFVCGYSSAAAVPERIKQWIVCRATDYYMTRSSQLPAPPILGSYLCGGIL